MESDRFQELCEEFCLSGLEGEELSAFQEELARRGPEGEAILGEVTRTLGLLALAAPPEPPPRGLRDRLLAEVHADVQAEAGAENEAVSEPVVGRVEATSGPAAQASGQGRAFARIGWGLLAAAVLATLVMGVWNYELRRELSEQQIALQEARERATEADRMQDTLALLREDLATIGARTSSMISLSGTDTRPEAQARVFVDPETGRALVLAYELPILPAASVYQLWAIREGEPFSVGTFVARDEGPARLELDSLDPVAGADLLAVTIEPAPGQPAPTGEMVLVSGE